jgi:hypothetical protein
LGAPPEGEWGRDGERLHSPSRRRRAHAGLQASRSAASGQSKCASWCPMGGHPYRARQRQSSLALTQASDCARRLVVCGCGVEKRRRACRDPEDTASRGRPAATRLATAAPNRANSIARRTRIEVATGPSARRRCPDRKSQQRARRSRAAIRPCRRPPRIPNTREPRPSRARRRTGSSGRCRAARSRRSGTALRLSLDVRADVDGGVHSRSAPAPASGASAHSTAASTWMRVESKTGTDASSDPTSRSISVQP